MSEDDLFCKTCHKPNTKLAYVYMTFHALNFALIVVHLMGHM